MKTLLQTNIDTVRAAMKGKRLEKFDASVAVLKESCAQGSWTLRGRVKAESGFYQGIAKSVTYGDKFKALPRSAERDAAWSLDMCLTYGQKFRGDFAPAFATLHECGLKLDERAARAWVELCAEKAEACAALDAARPAPRVTPIGLSPKVTATLTEMNLDLDLPSIRPAKIDFKWVKSDDLDREGNPMMVKHYFVSWTPGIAHGMSRFQSGCHACGKHIPSCRFVPVEAHDKKSGKLISMWLGVDCARNIFGIKDDGINKTGEN